MSRWQILRTIISLALLVVFGAVGSMVLRPGATAAPAMSTEAAREAFLGAMQRIASRVPETPDPASLRAYPLYDYLLAARFDRDLGMASSDERDSAIDAFLSAHGTQPVTRRLRHDWLTHLASRQQWALFLPRSGNVSDPSLLCARLAGRLATGDVTSLRADALARWLLPIAPARECAPVFLWIRDQGWLTSELAEQRTRTVLAAGNSRLARQFVEDVAADRAAPLRQWIRLLESPQPALLELAAQPATAVEADALAAGFGRLANSSSVDALQLLPALLARPNTAPALRARLSRLAALGAAYDHLPGVLPLFDALPLEALDTPVYEWRVRAALWAGDYSKALEWINQMPAELAGQPRWRYWNARAVAVVSGNEAAEPLFADIAGLRDYYGYLAADRLHRGYELNVHPSPDEASVQEELARNPGVIRARELIACEMIDDAVAEWAAVVGNAEPNVKVQAAHLAARWGWYTGAIATLAEAGEWDDVRLRYPRPYGIAIADAQKASQVPADWILAVMRQESLFRKDAVSRANARGLMQMLPATAAAVARRSHVAVPTSPEGLFEPEQAVILGALHLRELLDRFQDRLALALAAYNAGPEHVVRWLPRAPMEADVWIDNLPFGETRSYVQHIVELIVAIAWVRGAELPRLAELLPTVEPPRTNLASQSALSFSAGRQ